MIKEDTVIKIAEEYLFTKEKIKPFRQKTGVDFIFEGKAIEVKGSNSRFSLALSQFMDYAMKYRGLMLIFPTDFLSNPSHLFVFHLLCSLVLSSTHKSIEVVLVSEDEEFYYLKKLSSGHIIINNITYEIAYRIIKEKGGMKGVLENLDSCIQEAYFRMVKEKSDMMIPKSTIR